MNKKILSLILGVSLFFPLTTVFAYNANFLNTTLPDGYTSNPYTATVRFSYDGPYSPSAYISGLPSGIYVGGAGYGNGVYGIAKDTDGNYTVTLTGTPIQAGNYKINIQVYDVTHTVDITREFSLNIKTQSIDLLTTSLPSATVGVPYSTDINFSYYGTFCVSGTLTGLPSGITVYGSFASTPNQLSCLMGSQSFKISGTPTQGGNFTVEVYLTNNSGVSVAKNLNLAVGYAGTPGAFSQDKLSLSFSLPYGYTTRSSDMVTLKNISNSTASYYISVPNQPSWLDTTYNTNQQLSLTPNNTVGVGAQVNPSGLSVGTYTTNIYLTGNFSGSPVIIPVILTIYFSGSSGGSSYVTNNVVRVPLIRLYHSKTNKHNYTASRNEAGILEGQGWRIEGELGYIYASEQTDTEPIYRLYNSKQKKYFYTTSYQEMIQVTSKGGYVMKEIIGYMPKYSSVGQEWQVYRLYSKKANDHFYTTNYSERDSVMTQGYVWEGGFGGRLLSDSN